MKIGAFHNFVAVEKRAPGEYQQVCQAGVEEDVVQRLGIANLSEEGAEAPGRCEGEAA